MPEQQPPESAGTALADDLETTGLVADAFTVEVAGITAGVQPARKKRLGIGAWLAIVWLAGLIQSVSTRQYTAVQAYVALIAVAFVLFNAFVDGVYSVLDPRIRHARAAAA